MRKVRNKLMHNKNMKVSAGDLAIYTDEMVTLLEDQIRLLNDRAAQKAVRDIKQVNMK